MNEQELKTYVLTSDWHVQLATRLHFRAKRFNGTGHLLHMTLKGKGWPSGSLLTASMYYPDLKVLLIFFIDNDALYRLICPPQHTLALTRRFIPVHPEFGDSIMHAVKAVVRAFANERALVLKSNFQHDELCERART